MWKTIGNGITSADATEGDRPELAFVELCKHVKTHVIPANEGVKWECVRIEYWPDSGRIIAFPSRCESAGRVDRASCQIVFRDLLMQYEQNANTDLSDEDFDLAVKELEKVWMDEFMTAARKSELSGMHVQWWSSGEEKLFDEQI